MGFEMQLIFALLLAGAIYGGIRQDIKGIHESVRTLHKATKRAHRRIDKFIDERSKGNGKE